MSSTKGMRIYKRIISEYNKIYILPDNDDFMIKETHNRVDDFSVVVSDSYEITSSFENAIQLTKNELLDLIMYVNKKRDRYGKILLYNVYIMSFDSSKNTNFKSIIMSEDYDKSYYLQKHIFDMTLKKHKSRLSSKTLRLWYFIKQLIYFPFINTPIYWVRLNSKFSDQETLYVYIYQGIGDIIVSLGYLNAYIKKYQKEENIYFKRICLLRIARMKELYSMYSIGDGKQIVIEEEISKKEYKGLAYYQEYVLGNKNLTNKKNVLFIHTYNLLKDSWNHIYNLPNMTFMHLIKYSILNLPENAPFEYPQVEECDCGRLMDEKNISGNFVILNPFANSIDGNIGNDFWKKLAIELKQRNYKVLTDCGRGDQAPIIGTEVLSGTLSEMYYIAPKATAYIGFRSGMLDYLMIAGSRIIALFPPDPQADGLNIFKAFDINGLNMVINNNVNSRCCQIPIYNAIDGIKDIMNEIG